MRVQTDNENWGLWSKDSWWDDDGYFISYGYDQAVSDFMGGPGRRFFDLVAWFDRTIVDGAVNGTGRVVRSIGGELRATQTGLVRSYAAFVAVGAVALVAWFLVRTTF